MTEKINSVTKIMRENSKLYELKTIDKVNETESIIICPEKIVIETYNSLLKSKTRIEENISKLNQEIKTYDEIEEKYGKNHTDAEVEHFNEIAQLADARNNVGNKKSQIQAAREMILENADKLKKIEMCIPILLRIKN